MRCLLLLLLLCTSVITYAESCFCIPTDSASVANGEQRAALDQLLAEYYDTELGGQDSLHNIYALELADFYVRQDSFELALQLLIKSLRSEYLSPEDHHFASINAGLINSHYGDNQTALKYYFNSLETTEILDAFAMTLSLGNISEAYLEEGDLKNALSYALQALSYSKKIQGQERYYNLTYDYTGLSKLYDQLGYQDSVEHYIKLANFNIDKLDPNEVNSEAIINTYMSSYEYYLKTDRLDLAEEYLQKIKTASNKENEIKYLEAKFHLKAGNYSIAYPLIKGIPETQDHKLNQKILELKINCLEQENKYHQALIHYKKFNEEIKKQTNVEKIKYTTIANINYQTHQKIQEIEQLHYQQAQDKLAIDKQKMISLITFLFAFIAASTLLGLFYLYNQKKKYNHQLSEEVAEKTLHLENAQKILEQRNEELKRFNHIVSHDLKEPIRSIVSFSGLAKKAIEPEEKAHDYLDYVVKSGSHLYQLIQDIDEFNNSDSLEKKDKQDVDLDYIINEIENSIPDKIKSKNATIIHSNLPTIKSNYAALFIVFKNLIENGIKYNRSSQPVINIKHKETPTEHLIFITDNGVGIPKGYFNKIFELFSRLHNRNEFEGSGIGLANSKRLAEKINAQLSVHSSELGRGTTFLLAIKKPFSQIISVETTKRSQPLTTNA